MRLDLRGIDQLVDPSQTRAIARARCLEVAATLNRLRSLRIEVD